MIGSMWKDRKVAWILAFDNFRSRFAGSYFGILWAFIQPMVTVFVYWFIFEVGFKAGQSMDVPFVLYLVVGIVPWFFIVESLSGGTQSLIEYSYLVKKVVFNIDIIPLVKILAALFIHMFFLIIMFVLLLLYGYMPTVHIAQLPYIFVGLALLIIGMVYLTASVNVFFRDVTQFVNVIVIQLGVWLTPIMWDAESMLADKPVILKILKLNPVYYIVQTCRDSLLYHEWTVLKHPLWSVYFWCVTVVMAVIGLSTFKRLKVHYADVL